MLVSNTLFEKISSYVLIVNEEGKVLLSSNSFARLSGCKNVDMKGQYIWDYMKPFHKEARKTELIVKRKILLKKKETFQFETQLQVNNTEKYVLWDVSVDEKNQYMLVGNDITKRKEVEKKLQNKNKALQENQKDFIDSVNYAQKLQEAILPNKSKINEYVQEGFVLFKPKDIVSGDAYWLSRTDEHIFLAAIDCTGHGIPGAMLTVLAHNLLREIILKKKIYQPGAILNALDQELDATFNSEGNRRQTLDGLDIALVRIDKNSNRLKYATAMRTILIVRENQCIELKGDRYPIGLLEGIEKSFSTYEFQLLENDSVYLYSDGFADQFGGPKHQTGGKKFSKKKMKELLISIQDLSLKEQSKFLDYAHNNWKQNIPQTDDIVFIGLKYLQNNMNFS